MLCYVKSRHQKYIEKMSRIAYCSCHGLSTCAKYIAKNDMDCILLLLASRCLQDGPRWPQDGPKMAQDGLLGPPLELSWVQLVAILSQRKAIEGFILSQDNQKYIEKMGRFAYSLQEVLSYFILSPRCLHDGSKVAYGGREYDICLFPWQIHASSWPQQAGYAT